MARLQTAMERAAGVDALLLTNPADLFYTTGFLTRFWESPRAAMVRGRAGFRRADCRDPIYRGRADGPHHGWTTFAHGTPQNPVDDGVGLLADTLAQTLPGTRGHRRAHGVGKRICACPWPISKRLRARLAPRRIVDATDIVQRVREVKSEPRGLNRMRAILRTIAGAAFAATVPGFASCPAALWQICSANFQIRAGLIERRCGLGSANVGDGGPRGPRWPNGDVISRRWCANPLQPGR